VQDTVGELHKKACEVFDLIPDEVDILLGCLQYYVPPSKFEVFMVMLLLAGLHLGLLWPNKTFFDG
jgi:hypothetical protein